MHGEPAAATVGQPAVACELPDGCRLCWGTLGTVNQQTIDPVCRPSAGDGSERCRVVQCDVDCAAARAHHN
eukprot:2693160-Pyramimonas_sp.AAC.1